MSLTDTASVPLAETAAGVLDAVRETRAARDREDARLLALAVAWAVLHPAESVEELHEADPWLHADRPVVLAGEGTPRVGEFAIADFAGALRLPTESGRDLIADALELCHRLPRLWRRVQAGELPAWRARRIAHATMTLPVEGARFVDDRVAAFAHTVGPATVDRLVEEALVRFDPDTARERAEAAAENRHVTVRTDQVDSRGTVYLSGELDLADALDLDRALDDGARRLAALGALRTPPRSPLDHSRAGTVACQRQFRRGDTATPGRRHRGEGSQAPPATATGDSGVAETLVGPEVEASHALGTRACSSRSFAAVRRPRTHVPHVSARGSTTTGNAGGSRRLSPTESGLDKLDHPTGS